MSTKPPNSIPTGKINLSQPLADLLNATIISDSHLTVIQLDGNSLRSTPPAIVVVAVAEQAERIRQLLNNAGVKDSASIIIRPN